MFSETASSLLKRQYQCKRAAEYLRRRDSVLALVTVVINPVCITSSTQGSARAWIVVPSLKTACIPQPRPKTLYLLLLTSDGHACPSSLLLVLDGRSQWLCPELWKNCLSLDVEWMQLDGISKLRLLCGSV